MRAVAPHLAERGLQLESHPSRFFIRYLLLRGENDVDETNQVLRSLGLFEVEDESFADELEMVHSHRLRPTPYIPRKRDCLGHRRYWREMQVEAMFQENEESDGATKILSSGHAREDIETALLGHIPLEQITGLIDQKYGEYGVTDEVISTYKHYYFNPAVMTIGEWAGCLRDLGETGDRRLAVLRGGPDVALHRLGMKLELEGEQMMGRMQQSLYLRFQEIDGRGTNQASIRMMTELSREIRNLSDARRVGGDSLGKHMKAFEKFVMKTEAGKVPSISDLATGGSYTGSGKTQEEGE